MKRIIAAFLIAPGAYPLCMLLFSQNEMAVGVAWVFAMFTYPIAIIVGVPALMFFRAHHFQKWWHFVIGAGFIGFLPSLFIILLQSREQWLYVISGFIGIGAFSGLVFWFIAFWKSNQSHKNETPQSGSA